MAGLRTSRACEPSRRTRACHDETGLIRPPRGAERDLEVNGRRFRTATRPRRTGTGLDIDTGTHKADGDHQCCRYHAHLSLAVAVITNTIIAATLECGRPRRSIRHRPPDKQHPRRTRSLLMRDADRTTERLPRSRLLACEAGDGFRLCSGGGSTNRDRIRLRSGLGLGAMLHGEVQDRRSDSAGFSSTPWISPRRRGAIPRSAFRSKHGTRWDRSRCSVRRAR